MLTFALGMATGGALTFFFLLVFARADARRRAREVEPSRPWREGANINPDPTYPRPPAPRNPPRPWPRR